MEIVHITSTVMLDFKKARGSGDIAELFLTNPLLILDREREEFQKVCKIFQLGAGMSGMESIGKAGCYLLG